MRINSSRFIIALVLIGLYVVIYRGWNFNYVSLQENIGDVQGADYALKVVYQKPTRDLIAGLTINLERSYYIKDIDQKKVLVTVSIIRGLSREEVIKEESFPLVDFPYKGFKKIIFTEPVVNTERNPVVFRLRLEEPLGEGEVFNPSGYDLPETTKYENPRIIYHDSLKGIITEGQERLALDPAFSRPYTVIMTILLLSILALFVIEPTYKD